MPEEQTVVVQKVTISEAEATKYLPAGVYGYEEKTFSGDVLDVEDAEVACEVWYSSDPKDQTSIIKEIDGDRWWVFYSEGQEMYQLGI
jgi:hypothetical protein